MDKNVCRNYSGVSGSPPAVVGCERTEPSVGYLVRLCKTRESRGGVRWYGCCALCVCVLRSSFFAHGLEAH